MNIVDNLTEAQIAEVMAGLTKEEIFYYTDATDHLDFVNDVVGRLGKQLEIRADIFTLVFADGFDLDFADEVIRDIAEMRKAELEEWRAANPDLIDAPNPNNPIKSRWIRFQYESQRVDHRK